MVAMVISFRMPLLLLLLLLLLLFSGDIGIAHSDVDDEPLPSLVVEDWGEEVLIDVRKDESSSMRPNTSKNRGPWNVVGDAVPPAPAADFDDDDDDDDDDMFVRQDWNL